MSTWLFQKLNAVELDQYTSEFDHAIDAHSSWLAGVNRCLICHSPPRTDDLAEAPHRRCHFGRWYESIDRLEFRDIPEFIAIGKAHEQVHRTAQRLLRRSRSGAPISCDVYDELLGQVEHLRQLIAHVRGNLKRNLNLSQRLMRNVLEKATEGVVITDPNGIILSANRAFTEETDFSPGEIIGQPAEILYSGRHDDAFYRALWRSLRSRGEWQGEIWSRRRNGEVFRQWLSISAVRNEQEQLAYFVAIFSDISGETENEARLYRLAHYDSLTGLPNRMLFLDRLRQALSRARRGGRHVAILFLDLDGFKAVNDAYGHQAGDRLLYEVGQRLTRSLRESDTVARFGGDEFTLVIADLDDPAAAASVARKIIAVMARPYDLDEEPVGVTASIGISVYPTDSQEPETLINYADEAMYQSKREGKNRFSFFATA